MAEETKERRLANGFDGDLDCVASKKAEVA